MGFTTPAFILKNTPELRKKLGELGYKVGNEVYINDDFLATDNNEMFGIDEPYRPEQCNGYIHCGANEYLFLAIAALRDDVDIHQWFTDGNEWFLCKYLKVGMHYQDKPEILFKKWHKATVKELKEFFSREIEIPTIRWNMGDVIYDASDYCHRIGVQKSIGKKVVYRNGEAVDASYCVHFYESGKRWVIMERLIGSLNAFIVAGERIIVTDNVIIPFCKFNPADINESIKYSLI